MDLGPLHVVWQVSFGCWITWPISSWQNSYKSVFFPKAEWWVFLNDNICSYTKKAIWHLAIWQNWYVLWSILSFKNLQDWKVNIFFRFSGKSERIESIHFAESSGLSCWETEKEVLLPITQLWERRHSYNTFVCLR